VRARNLKPSIFRNELLALSDPIYTIVFAGLWCLSDRAGRLEDRPAKIHLEINPGRAFDLTETSLQWLSDRGFITRYEAGKVRYIQVVNFAKHQNPHVKEPQSTIPAPCESGASTVPARLTPDSGFRIPDSGLLTPDCSPPESGRPRKRAATRTCPDDFELTVEMIGWAEKNCPGVDVDRETAAFKDYTFANGKTDWVKTWRNWMRKAKPAAGRRLTKYEESMAELDRRSAQRDTSAAGPPVAALGSDLWPQVRGSIRPVAERGVGGGDGEYDGGTSEIRLPKAG
jgi:hypothetical protein